MKLVGSKWFKLFVSSILLWLTLLTMFLYMQPSALRFGLVDMQILISTQAKQLVSQHPANVPREVLQDCFTNIKEVLQTYSRQHNIILLSKSSVVEGELDDVTDAILEKLQEKS